MYRFLLLFATIITIFSGQLALSAYNITGKVVDSETGKPIPGATVEETKSGVSVKTGDSGMFTLSVEENIVEIKVSADNYFPGGEQLNAMEIQGKMLTFELVSIDAIFNTLQGFYKRDVTVYSSRYETNRSAITTAAPVDVISGETLAKSGNVELGKAMTEIIPSFNSQRQTFSDGTDHIDPATLRGLGPDQVLVLINGKRRHTTALVNVTPVVGKGAVGTDLNAIPVSAVERIEVLRDGASAIYGSDAIAGVINIVLKKSSDFELSTNAGQAIEGDGQYFFTGANTGIIMNDGGFINFTGELRRREPTDRAGDYTGAIFSGDPAEDERILNERGLTRDYFDLKIGNSAQTNAGFFVNSEIPVNENSNIFFFGGINYRESRSPGFYRLPNDPRNNPEIYPNGFLPNINAKIRDQSVSAGFNTKRNGWNIEFSNTLGNNSYDYFVENSLNRAYGSETPTDFYSGSLGFTQNTSNLDFDRNFGNQVGIPSFKVSFGMEFRIENYRITKGEEASYATLPQYADSTFEPGAQVFPGFRPENVVDESRTSGAVYLSAEADITDNFLVEAAGRFESYSDFGETANGKLSARYSLFDKMLTARASASTGFRAPSLHQKYFSSVSTFFVPVQGQLYPFDVATVTNNSRAARAFGIPELKEETSTSLTAGLTSKITENTLVTVDAYRIDIDDRIVLSGLFTPFDPLVAELLAGIPGADAAQFFSNAINTRTRGIDVIISHEQKIGNSTLGITFAGSIFENEIVGDIKVPENLPDRQETLFNREEQSRITEGIPGEKFTLNLDYRYKYFGINVRNTYYGEVGHKIGEVDPETGVSPLDQNYGAKVLTDAELRINATERLQFKVGGNNILDVYPDENKEIKQDNGRFPYNTAVTQFGFNGAYFYAGLNIRL